jgi:hypothetical protein
VWPANLIESATTLDAAGEILEFDVVCPSGEME